jgi:Zn-dependent protease
MRWSIAIGSIAGIRLELHVTFLIFLGWIALSTGLTTGDPVEALASVVGILLIFGCVLLHELGHAMAARRYGIRTRDIILLPIGGLARLQRMPSKPTEELVVALAGPAVNVAILGVLWLFGVRDTPMRDLPQAGIGGMLFFVNKVMVLFNMIPAFPMDGGRVLRALLAMAMPHVRATRIAAGIGQALALVLGVVGLFTSQFMLVFVAVFVFLAAGEERALVETRSSLAGLPVSAAMVTDYHALDVRDPLQRAVDLLMSGDQQDFPVLDQHVPYGMLTRSDLVLALQRFGAAVPVGQVLPRAELYAEVGEPLEAAVQRMREQGRSALPVLRDGGVVGMITLENVGDVLVVRDALRRYAGGA